MSKRVVKRITKRKGNFKKKRDKGLSTIVATLLVILLTLVAVGVIWVVIRNVINQGAEQVSLGKFTLNLEIKSVTIDPATPSNINVKIKRNPGEGTISGLNFIITDGDTTEVVKLINFSLNELEERTINLTLKSITNSSKILKVSVAPIFRLESGRDVTGDVKDEYIIPKSSGSGVSTGCLSASECNDGNACTTDSCNSGTCLHVAITACVNNDGCCPSGCTSVNDNNCVQCTAANQATACNDSNFCTNDLCPSGVCTHPAITACVNNDGCCPSGCTVANDNNCVSVCGNGIREGSEGCDDGDLISGDGCSSTCAIESGYTCNTATPNVCTLGCTPESNVTFCTRLGKNCGSVTALDNCGTSRTVTSCGTCTSPQTCGGGGTANVCGSPSCTAETNTVFCTRLGKNCGSVTANDNCGNSRTVTSCGMCTGGQTCNSTNQCEAPTYYLSPSGSDSTGNGSITRPWFTLNKAWTVIAAGNTVYMRGGTYRYTSSQELEGESGTAGNMINVFAYPGETPIITKASSYSPRSGWNALIYFSGNYVHFKGLDVSGFTQSTSDMWTPFMASQSNNCIFELLKIHDSGGGFWLRDDVDGGDSDNNLFLNSDFYNNQDPLTSGAPYGDADGLGININIGNTVTIRGCRTWWNTDDGIDPYGSDATIIIENSWSFYNGYLPGTFNNLNAGGSGFKLGSTHTNHGNTILITLTNNIAYRNGFIGFDQNGAMCGIRLYNNIAYLNERQGFYFLDYNIAHVLKNNIAYGNGAEASISSASTLANNTFLYSSDNPSFSVSDSDFVILDGSQLLNSRKADGSLPDITFLHLAQGSDLINRGVNVGLPFSGSSPDLGAFETNY